MLAIVVVSYKSNDLTALFFKNEICKISANYKLIIVDNEASLDSSLSLAKKVEGTLVTNENFLNKNISFDSKVYIINASQNLGFAKGCNVGATFAIEKFKCKYILFTNNDIKLKDRDVVEVLLKKISSDNTIGIIGPRVIGNDDIEQSPEPYVSFWKRYVLMYWLTPFVSSKCKKKIFMLDYSKLATEGIHYKIMGSFFISNASHYVSCGMMDEKTFLYAEEVILSERMASINKVCYYIPTVTVIHDHGATTSKFLDKRKKQLLMYESEFYYYNQYKKIHKLNYILGKISILLVLNVKNCLEGWKKTKG